MGHKQMREVRRRSVSQACCQSFDGTRLLDICLAVLRDVTNDLLGSARFTFLVTFLANLVMLFERQFIPFHHGIKTRSIGSHFA